MFDLTRVFTVHPKDVDAVRPWLIPYLEKFASTTCLATPEDVIRQAKNCECQLWSYHDGEQFRGVVGTRIHEMARGKLCSLWLCVATEAPELMDGMFAEIERWARSIGCYGMEISGREGWLKKLPGFKKKAVLLEKIFVEMH